MNASDQANQHFQEYLDRPPNASNLANQHLQELLDRTRMAPMEPEPFVKADPYGSHYQAHEDNFQPQRIQQVIQEGDVQPCQNWILAIAEDGDEKLQIVIINPSTIGGEMPVFVNLLISSPLDDEPPPFITIPDTAGEYLIYVKFEWEPDVTELGPGDWVINADGGTLVPYIKIIVAETGTPPTDETPTIDGTDGSVTQNGIQHRRWAKVERGSEGELDILQNEFCTAMEYAICAGRVRLGRV